MIQCAEVAEKGAGDRLYLAMNNNDNTPIPVGFRFHPTDEELVGYYLHGKVGRSQRDQLIQELDLYKIEPWDLHGKRRRT